MFRGKLAVFNFGVKLQLGFDLRMGFKLQPIFLQFFSTVAGSCPCGKRFWFEGVMKGETLKLEVDISLKDGL